MTQREVQDTENTTWTCVQALSGLTGQAAEEAAERIESEEGTVPVVCTPNGGEQSGAAGVAEGLDGEAVGRRLTEVQSGGSLIQVLVQHRRR